MKQSSSSNQSSNSALWNSATASDDGYGSSGSQRGGSPTSGTDSFSSPTGTASLTPLDIATMLRQINAARVNFQPKNSARSPSDQWTDAHNGVIPSGPRKPGQGCEEAHQAIMLAEATDTGGVRFRITLLAAGFIIGPIGGCVRDISRISGAEVRSKTMHADHLCPRDTREFTIEGPTDASVAHAMSIMMDAVKRYKTLCEGGCAGQIVSRSQHVSGVEFFYQPPPRSIVPFAACLKGNAKRATSGAPKPPPGLTKGPSPKPSSQRPSTFKDAVVGVSSTPRSARSSPLKRAASSPPEPLSGTGTGTGLSSEEKLFATAQNHHLITKVSKPSPTNSLNREGMMVSPCAASHHHQQQLSAVEAATGLPFISLNSGEGIQLSKAAHNVPPGSSYGNALVFASSGAGGVLVPLNMAVASQALQLPQQQNQRSGYSAGELLSVLTSQLQSNLGLDSHQPPQQAQQAPTPFFGHYHAEQRDIYPHQQQNFTDYNNRESIGLSAFNSVIPETLFISRGGSSVGGYTGGATPASSLRTVLSTESAFSTAYEDFGNKGAPGSGLQASLPSLFRPSTLSDSPALAGAGGISGLHRALYLSDAQPTIPNTANTVENAASGSLFGTNMDLSTAFAAWAPAEAAPAAPATPAVWEPQRVSYAAHQAKLDYLEP